MGSVFTSKPTLLASEAETAAVAGRLAAVARPGDAIGLRGDLGVGKTAFARAFVRARLGADEDVPSPTFTLVQTYENASSSGPIFHFDLYRITEPEDALELGFEEALAHGVTLIEWPERLGTLLPTVRLDVMLEPAETPDARILTLSYHPSWRQRLKEAGLA